MNEMGRHKATILANLEKEILYDVGEKVIYRYLKRKSIMIIQYINFSTNQLRNIHITYSLINEGGIEGDREVMHKELSKYTDEKGKIINKYNTL